MHERIVELARAAASPSEAEDALLEALCTAAEAQLTARLRKGVTAADCGDAFPCAAALLAAAGLLPCRGADGVEQFTAGDVSIRTGGSGCEAGAALRAQAAALMAPYWEDGGFAFMGVRG